MAVQTQIQTRRGTAASWTSTNPTLAAGEIGFESDTGKIKIGTGSTAWNALTYTASSTAVTYLFNATAAQTTFSGADANGLTLAYTVGSEQVYLNGVLQVRGSDYTATNGTSIVLTSGALVSDVLNVIAFSALALSDTYTQAQADAKFFQNANAFVAGKNKIINGDFGVWQRGTSFSNPATSAYTSDRWAIFYDGTAATRTISQQTFTPGTAPVAGYEGQFFYRYAVSVAGTSNTINLLRQYIEDVRTFAGQTVTVSFWAKAAANLTMNSVGLTQNFGSGGSGGVDTNVTSNIAVTTSWQRFTYSVAVPSVSGKTIGTSSALELRFFLPVGANTFTFDIWGVQLETGSIATPFQTATGTIQGELAACQRYYYRRSGFGYYASGYCNSTTNADFVISHPTTMRVAPTMATNSGTNYFGFQIASGLATANSIGNFYDTSIFGTLARLTTTGLVLGQGGAGTANNASAYLEGSAEL
jgi:hypothetical protein